MKRYLLILLVMVTSTMKVQAEPTVQQGYQMLNKSSFLHYMALFNEKNPQAFEAYYADDIVMQNGMLFLNGIDEIKQHYQKIWKNIKEELILKDFVMQGDRLAVELHTHFTVLQDDTDSPFGPVKKGETFDYYGVIMYRINEIGKFNSVKVAYLNFTRTTDGKVTSLGIAH